MGNVYTVNEILVGALSDRPAPDRNIILYVDSATGKASLADGTRWNDFGGASLRGVTGDGLTPPGIDVDGQFSAGWTEVFNNTNTAPIVHKIGGIVQLLAGQQEYLDGDDSVTITQKVTTTADEGDPGFALTIVRLADRTATGPITWPVFAVQTRANGGSPAVTADEIVANFSGQGQSAAQVNAAGMIGLHGVTPPTAPRTLAQSVITAITDANAKTAVQAIANALSDMGALTLT